MMQQFKIDNFKQYSGEEFPAFSSLTRCECQEIGHRLKKILGMCSEATSLEVMSELLARQTPLVERSAESDQFNLQQTLSNLGIRSESNVFINWCRFDDIDRFALEDLGNYFWDIWYPSSDDIEVFDSSLNWILAVRHDGLVSNVRLS